MAATVTQSFNPQLVTNSADTNDHDIDCSAFIQGVSAIAEIRIGSGNVRFSQMGQITSATLSPTYTTTDGSIRFTVTKDNTLHFRGGAGSETFKINIINAVA
jgi:hypothetical protein